MTTLDPYAHYDGAYVLGALSDDERADFERHLLTCTACTERVRELTPLPALLAGVPASAYDDHDDEPPSTLLPGLLKRVRAERRRRHLLTAGLAGLAAACLVALVIAVWPSSHPAGNSPAPQPQAMTALIASPVHATALLRDVKWGTQIRLTCRYDEFEEGIDYQLIVVDKQNVSHEAGSWALAGTVTNFTGGTSLSRNQISKIEVTWNGQAILQLTT